MENREQQTGPVARAIDAVTPSYVGRPDTEMHAVGLAIGGLLLLGLLLPLLPVFAAYVLADRAVTFLRRQTAAEPVTPESVTVEQDSGRRPA